MYYFKHENEIKHSSFTVIAENNTHDVVSVYIFIKSLIEHLKNVFSSDKVKKNYYFSDGCAGQYKNCKHFLNLCHHKEDFGVEAEWHFFATSHGKGASDGVGGTIKREAAKESLRRAADKQILTAFDLFQFAKTQLSSMNFTFIQNESYFEEQKVISKRLEQAKTIAGAGTQKLHCFVPTSTCVLSVKEFSLASEERSEKATYSNADKLEGQLSGYVTVKYSNQWWLAYILNANEDDVTVKFMHPAGPSSSFYFPSHDDICIVHKTDLLLSVDPTTATGRTYTLSIKEKEITDAKLLYM